MTDILPFDVSTLKGYPFMSTRFVHEETAKDKHV